MTDSSPTSGGSGDQILTIDTYTDTGTGLSGVKVAAGTIRRVVAGRDFGDVGPVNELDVQDARANATRAAQTLSLRQALEVLIARLEFPLTTVPRPARSTKSYSVAASLSSTKLVDPAGGRVGLLLYNDASGTGNLFVAFGADAAGSGAGLKSVRLIPGAYYEVPQGWAELPLMGIWDATGGFCDVTEAF